jgi:hypothetical protein
MIFNQVWSENTAVQIYLKIILFSIWIPNSEERKVNPRKPYLGVLVTSDHPIPDGAHDFISRLILSVLDFRLVKTFFKIDEVKIY